MPPLEGLTWAGIMVRSGTVVVKGRIGSGEELTASAPITVIARDWSGKTPNVNHQRVRNGSPQTQPTLPAAVKWAHDLGVSAFLPTSEDVEQVQSGPNADYWYFADVKFEVNAYYSINDEAFELGSDFTRAQEPNSSDSRNRIGGVNYCQQRDVPGVAAQTEEHELAHIRVFRERFSEVVKPEYARLEAMYGKSDIDLADAADALRDDAL